jgi:hypothetical protein
MTYFYATMSPAIRGGYFRYFTQYIMQIPIRRLNLENPAEKAQHDKLVSLVEKMLVLKAQLAELENSLSDRRHEVRESLERTDKEIDNAVYALYGLSADEIAIVEG